MIDIRHDYVNNLFKCEWSKYTNKKQYQWWQQNQLLASIFWASLSSPFLLSLGSWLFFYSCSVVFSRFCGSLSNIIQIYSSFIMVPKVPFWTSMTIPILNRICNHPGLWLKTSWHIRKNKTYVITFLHK